MPKLYLQSLGCNKNLVDSEIMLGRLENYTIVNNPCEADVLIVNTCGFIKSAKEESINSILALHNERKKDSLLVVTGCLMQRYKDELIKALPEVDLFTGTGDFERIDELILKKQNLFSTSVYLQNEDTKRIITGSNSHAFVKIAEGCNQQCSFCAIPTFKGKLRSRPLKSIVAEVEKLVKQGFFDFSFIAQDSSSYLLDEGQRDGLLLLIEEIEKIRGVRAGRILYLYPTSTSERLIKRIIASSVFVNYFDMPLQHISDKMLKVMQRGDKKHFIKLLNLMQNANESFLRTGFIVGHPNEDESDFKALCEFILDFNFDRISVFGYSKEEDTKAFSMPQIPSKIINSRLKIIEKIVDKKIEQSFSKQIGKVRPVVCTGVSSEGEFFIAGKDLLWDRDIDGEILINESECGRLEQGKIYECLITQSVDKKLIATALRQKNAFE